MELDHGGNFSLTEEGESDRNLSHMFGHKRGRVTGRHRHVFVTDKAASPNVAVSWSVNSVLCNIFHAAVLKWGCRISLTFIAASSYFLIIC